jgi:peroxiredoxin
MRNWAMAAVSVTSVFVSIFLAGGLFAQDSSPSIRLGHNLLEEHDSDHAVRIGEEVGEFGFRDIVGRTYHVRQLTKLGPVVIVFLSTKCPLAQRYAERLKRLSAHHSTRGVTVIGVYANADETADDVASMAAAAGFSFPIVLDSTGYVARRLGATMTPQTFLLDQQMVLRYRGAIDDNRYEDRVRHSYLASAIDALLAGRTIEPSSTPARGCTVHLLDPADAETVTYSEHIARILQDNCQSCHRSGQVAPFTLASYDDAKRWREEIQAYTHQRLMPPWKAVSHIGEFVNDISLTDAEIGLISRWVEQGALPGDVEQVPPNPEFDDGWAFGEPDLIVSMPEPYTVGPEGEDDYRHFVIPYEFAKDRYVEAVDVRPGNRRTVHHVLVYVDKSARARELDMADPGPGYSRFGGPGFESVSNLGGWAPGNRATKTPPNTGAWLPDRCDIVLQVHYYRTGVEERDLTRVGLYFAKSPHPVRAYGGAVINTEFELPAGARSHRVTGEQEIQEASYLFSITPHMHLLGRSMEVVARQPDGAVRPLIRIDDWDFNWQTTYHFRQLQYLPAGTRLEMTATFDNSSDNGNNPHDPPQSVRWGEKTTDEMCICFVGLVAASEYDHETLDRRKTVGDAAE